MRRKIAEFLLGGWRVHHGRLTLRFMPLRWYVGPGIAPGYFALNVGPIQLFVAIGDLIAKLPGWKWNREEAD